MPDSLDDQLGFAPDYDSPVPYMQRTRDYYAAIGYTTPYRWAHYVDAPFQPLKKPLAQSRVTIITTAAPYDPAKGDQGPGAAYNGSAKFYKVYDGDTSKQHDLRISHIGYDRKHTSATDSGTWFPLPQLLKAASRGADRRGRAALLRRADQSQPPRHHRRRCARKSWPAASPTRSMPRCWCRTARSATRRPRLVARHLEANGIPTVVMGCAKDIVEHAAVPRFLFSDFPLGNSAGKPHDVESQAQTLELALRLLERAPGAAHHDAVAAALERGCLLEARLQQHRADERGRTGAAPRRIRQAERDRARQPGGVKRCRASDQSRSQER